ncbi:ABC transporter substrate-binding protein [Amycolatopsis acidicola]|uniref:ABC transporter substrate-binding protein n=1 Tax=Amycolatopsis acidicola TaxID=2596893 RepID=A0A5N0UYI3_9PSEU|nr:PhnD/SsuA/transferrin family substrate-binding protein [Amycolatopsis acidicola]KAA9156686.1 ABC transporter substrate-binding protein [Amycolatopsis acidicola]
MSLEETVLGRRAVLLGGVAGLGALLAACGSSGAAGGKQAKVEDTQKGTAGAVVRPIAEQQNLLGGLQLSYVAGTGPGDVQNKLLSGALDTASMGPIGAVVANDAGAGLTVFSTSLNNHVRWLVPENSPYRTTADLRGKRIAAPPNNSDAYRSAQLAAAVNGIDFEQDYEIHQGAVLAGLALFDRGDVEGIVTIEPNATRLVAKGARQLATIDQLWQQGTGRTEPLLLNGQGARADWVRDHSQIADALAKLRLDVHQKIHERPQVLAELADYYGVPATEKAAIALLPERLKDIYPVDWGQSAAASMDTQIQAAVKYGLLKAAPATPVYTKLTS